MVFRRVAALGFLGLVLVAFVGVPSCTDCADGGVGCPCQTPQECNIAEPCTRASCNGTCLAEAVPEGYGCALAPCIDGVDCNGVCTNAGVC